jgi:hypothetical protein
MFATITLQHDLLLLSTGLSLVVVAVAVITLVAVQVVIAVPLLVNQLVAVEL